MNAWAELPEAARNSTWDRFEARFRFRPSTIDWPGILEPEDSVTYGIGHVYGDAERYGRLTLDLSHKLVLALQRCVSETGVVHVLDWQHQCYSFMPHVPFTFSEEDDWPVPVLPNGDYYIFLDPELEFGVFGHPWEQTMCVLGTKLIDALAIDPPRLFDRQVRIGGKVV